MFKTIKYPTIINNFKYAIVYFKKTKHTAERHSSSYRQKTHHSQIKKNNKINVKVKFNINNRQRRK